MQYKTQFHFLFSAPSSTLYTETENATWLDKATIIHPNQVHWAVSGGSGCLIIATIRVLNYLIFQVSKCNHYSLLQKDLENNDNTKAPSHPLIYYCYSALGISRQYFLHFYECPIEQNSPIFPGWWPGVGGGEEGKSLQWCSLEWSHKRPQWCLCKWGRKHPQQPLSQWGHEHPQQLLHKWGDKCPWCSWCCSHRWGCAHMQLCMRADACA